MKTATVKYEVENWIKENYSIGDRLPSERVIGEKLHISRDTVRAALNSLLADGYLHMPSARIRMVSDNAPTRLWDAKSYFIATTGAEFSPEFNNLESLPVIDKIKYGVASGIENRQLFGINFADIDDMNKVIESLQKTLPRGLIYFNRYSIFDNLLRDSLYKRIPIVSFGDTCTKDDFDNRFYDTVSSDHYMGGRLVIEGLLKLGCRQPIYFNCSNNSLMWELERRRGMFDACKDNNIELLEVTSTNNWGDFGNEKLFELCVKIAAKNLEPYFKHNLKIDALIAPSDDSLPIAARGLELLGINPDRDLILAGYDNNYEVCQLRNYCQILPKVTVDVRNVYIGAMAIELLHQRINGELPAEPHNVVIEPKIIIK